MGRFVEIAVNIPQVSGVFHYHLESELSDQVRVGHLVEVPFGRRIVQGVVLRFVERPAIAQTKAVISLIDEDAVVTPAQIALAEHLAETTLAPLAACLGLMLPPGLAQQADMLYSLAPVAGGGRPLTPLQTRLVTLLKQRGPLRGRQLDQLLPRVNWRASAAALVRRELLRSRSVLPEPRVRPKAVRTVQLACPPEQAEAVLSNLGRQGSQALARRQEIIRYLLREPGPQEVTWVYAASGGNSPDLRKLEALGLVTLGDTEVWRDPLAEMEPVPTHPPPLTADQAAAWGEIRAGLQAAATGQPVQPFLLHGVTGSGKTEVYLQAVQHALASSKRALVLVPEIALTPQTVQRFLARFPGQVGLVHSRLSEGERYDTWRRARAGQLSVIVGPRSALFTPLADLALIILDECHDDSYYQSEPPFYHAVETALVYARLTSAVCVLGSATPNVADAYRAAQGEWHYLHLPARILAHQQSVQRQAARLGSELRYRPLEGQAQTMELPPVEIVDMRSELKAGNRSIFSRGLQTELSQVLAREQQAILFLNRRGTATYVFCRDCGAALHCPRCELPLTYHRPDEQLTCHYCGYQRQMPATCPACGSKRIRHYGTGTERVEAEVQAAFPTVRTLRWDYETTRTKGAHQMILSQFAARRADMLIGTQMLAKGLDLPLVTLVGVVLADVGINLPDYSASERTFQVLTQVAGRAGRSPLGGKVILQTFQPEHYAIHAAAGHDYRGFYRQEIAYRRHLSYPPFAQVVRLEYRHTDNERARQAALQMGAQLRDSISARGRRATEIVGPVPCFFARLGGIYRWQIVLRGPDPVALLRGRDFPDWRLEVNPPSLL